MRFSLLYKVDEICDNPNVIYDLSIDRFVDNIGVDQRKKDYFCHILSRPLVNLENIAYRRDILNDIIEIEGLLPALRLLFNRYDKIKSDWLELKSGGSYSGGDRGSEAMLDYTYSSLKVTSLFPKTIQGFYSSIVEILSEYDIKSEGLISLRDYAKEMIANRSLKDIVDIASMFMYNNCDDYDFDISVKIGDGFDACDAEICGVEKRERKKTSILGFLSKKKQESGVCEDLSEPSRDQSKRILGETLFNLDKLLEEITDQIYDRFYGISKELDFYDVSLRYYQFLRNRGCPYIFPEMGGETAKCRELYDLLLLSEPDLKVCPNDFDFGRDKGVLIRGKNNTGKTTFLRSYVTAQLFAQAGLPIAAGEGSFPIFKKFFTHFSSSEEEFIKGDSSGRFEGEVKAISEIVDSLVPESLVVLNETFQTTSYDEGAKGIASILRALNKLSCRFIFVTHLTDLFDMFDEDVQKLESADGGDPFTIKKLKEIRK